MAGTTFSFAYTTPSPGTVSFGELSTAAGKYALSLGVSGITYDVKRFHPPGVDGNYAVISGATGYTINATVRYVGIRNDVLTAFEDDMMNLSGRAVTATLDSGTEATNCILIHASRLTQPKAMANTGGYVFMDAEFVFTSEMGE